MLMPTQTAKLLGEPLAEPAFLRIPGASLEGLSRMGDETKRQGYHFSSYITRVDFDPQQAYPKMRFKAKQQLTNQEADFILKMRKDPIALRIIGQGEQRPQLAPPAAQAIPQGGTDRYGDSRSGERTDQAASHDRLHRRPGHSYSRASANSRAHANGSAVATTTDAATRATFASYPRSRSRIVGGHGIFWDDTDDVARAVAAGRSGHDPRLDGSGGYW